MTRLLRSIEHRKHHRRRKEGPDKYDIEMKRLKAVELTYALHASMPCDIYRQLELEVQYKTNKQNQGNAC